LSESKLHSPKDEIATMGNHSKLAIQINADSKTEKRRRMSPKDRETLIVQEAINFFAEHGLEGKTRELANRIGITQPLLYRYFPSKEKLIERVYQEVYVQRWNPKWDSLITDRGRPLKLRLIEFYKEYAIAIYDYDWIRIFLYSGLKGVDINGRYLSIIKNKVLVSICGELRHAHGLPPIDDIPVSTEELEIVWGLHGMFFYRAVRHFAYDLPLTQNLDDAIENDITIFLAGVSKVHKKILKKSTT
jgi:AcrR family transcriptional regulator